MREPAASNRFQSNTSAMPALKRPEASHFASSRATGDRAKGPRAAVSRAPRRSGRSAKPRALQQEVQVPHRRRPSARPAAGPDRPGTRPGVVRPPGPRRLRSGARKHRLAGRIKRKILAGLKQHRLRLAKVERLVGEVKLDAPVLPVGNQISQQRRQDPALRASAVRRATPCAS